jgi:hypothetical protein
MRRAKATAILGAVLGAALSLSGRARADGPEAPIETRFPPRTLPYDERLPIPPGYHLEERPTKSYVVMGATIFGAAYLPSLFVTAAVVAGRQPDAPRVSTLAIPIAGPFVTIIRDKTGVPGGVALVADGIAQTSGAILFIAGLKIPEPVLVLTPIPASAKLSFGPGSVSLRGEF